MSSSVPTGTPTTTSSTSSATSTGYPYGSYWGGGSGFSSTWVTWVSVVVIAGVLIALLCSRYFYIRRFYSPSLRAYFVPPKGVHIDWLHLHIDGPPQRIPREPPPSYAAAARRRRRRGRPTAGETIGEGGRRVGDRDADDGWDDLNMVERQAAAPADELPRYFVDSGLPGYCGGEGDAAEEAERIRAEAAAAGEGGAIPSTAEYEAAIRASRNPTTSVQLAYPPTAHLTPPTTDLVRPVPLRSSLSRTDALVGDNPQDPPRTSGSSESASDLPESRRTSRRRGSSPSIASNSTRLEQSSAGSAKGTPESAADASTNETDLDAGSSLRVILRDDRTEKTF